jgi:hypothetical protein
MDPIAAPPKPRSVPVEVASPKWLEANKAVLVEGFGDVAKYAHTRGCSK